MVSYRVWLPGNADREVRVEACARGLGPVRWEPLASARASPAIAQRERGACLEYTARPSGLGPYATLATSDAFVGGDGGIFLRPANAPASVAIEVRFEAPPGVQVSSAWRLEQGIARPDRTFLHRESHFAFGSAVRIARFEVAGAHVERVRLPGALAVTDDELDRWLRDALRAVAGLLGRFPRDHVQIIVLPVPSADAPVPFGLVRRGGGASVLLLASEGAELDALRRDWVAVHELAHLIFPHIDRKDAWLSEGLSTYYQEIFRARAGLIPAREAWGRLVAGFERGRRGEGALPLGLESERMMATRSFHRVYWSGAAFALLADLELRARGTSLDALVLARAEELAAAEGSLRADQLLARLELPLGEPLLTDRASSFERSASFPELAEALRTLGIARDDAGEVRFSEAPEARALRAAIMGGD